MRLKPLNSAFFIVACFALLSAIAVHGQDEKGQSDEPLVKDVKENLRNDPDPSLVESESRSISKPPAILPSKETVRDSSAVQVKAPKPLKSNEKVPKEEDPLSFNFLYYIIEKFKLSDIIE